LERVIWLPNRCPPHKDGLSYEHRRLMVKCAIASHPAFVLPPLAPTNPSPDYAISTLPYLQQTYPNCQWYWIIGLDAFATLPRWYRRESLIPAYEWLVAPRTPVVVTAAVFRQGDRQQQGTTSQSSWLSQQVVQQLASQGIPIRWRWLQMSPLDISSTLIRHYCRQHRSIRQLVPEDVQAYIMTHNLYILSGE
jgi:nicotinate-nucleotide adenylyltransferase